MYTKVKGWKKHWWVSSNFVLLIFTNRRFSRLGLSPTVFAIPKNRALSSSFSSILSSVSSWLHSDVPAGEEE